MALYLGPSAAGRWLKCTASPGYIEREKDNIPPEEEKIWSVEGTEAHDLAAEVLRGKPTPKADASMLRHVEGYVSFAKSKLGMLDRLLVEEKIPLFYMPHRNGVVDAASIGESVHIVDLKYGEGLSVEAEGNSQMAIYLRSLIEDLRAKGLDFPLSTPVSMSIYQPRARDGRIVRAWETTLQELIGFTNGIRDVAAKIQANPNGGDFFPSTDVCRFCDARKICVARAQDLYGVMPPAIQDLSPIAKPADVSLYPHPTALTPEQISEIVAVKTDFIKWLEDVHALAKDMLKDGRAVPGWKLVPGRNVRAWSDEDAAARALNNRFPKHQIYTRKLVSPAQAEALLKDIEVSSRLRNKINALIVKSEGGPVLAPDSDPRTEILSIGDFLEDLSKPAVNTRDPQWLLS